MSLTREQFDKLSEEEKDDFFHKTVDEAIRKGMRLATARVYVGAILLGLSTACVTGMLSAMGGWVGATLTLPFFNIGNNPPDPTWTVEKAYCSEKTIKGSAVSALFFGAIGAGAGFFKGYNQGIEIGSTEGSRAIAPAEPLRQCYRALKG